MSARRYFIALIFVIVMTAVLVGCAAVVPTQTKPPVSQEPTNPTGGDTAGGTVENPGTKPGTNSGANPGTNPTKPATKPADKPSTIWIDVDVTAQRVKIMDGDTVTREMIASTGAPGKETPLGTFKIQNRGEWFFSQKYSQGGKWWVSFKDWGVYLFHSVPMDKDKVIIPEEAAKLGTPASHGCVRLSVENAKWIYDNIKQGTKVVIHQ